MTYSGADVSAVADSRGKITVTSTVLGIVYEIAVLDDDGQSVSGIELTYSESGGKSVVYITDSSGKYADVIMIGTPSELSAQFPRSKKTSYRSESATSYNLGVTLKQKGGLPTGFTSDAANLNSAFFGTSERTGTGWSTVCAISSEISDTLSSIDGSKILLFSGLTADSSLYMKTGSSWSGDALTAAITQKLAEVFGMSFSNAFLASYQITCYAPDGGIGGIGAVCEITKSNDVCQSTPGGGETNTAPVINGTPSTTVTAGTNYSFIPSAADADGDTLTYSIENKPSWASFDTSTGALIGTTTAGVFSDIVISVTDGTDTASLASFTITVSEQTTSNNAPVINGTPSTTAMSGTSYSFVPSAADADGDTLTYSISNKPSWASFNTSTGALTGTTTAGVFSGIVISVTDGTDTASLASFTITVSEQTTSNTAPVINGTPSTTAMSGTSYSFVPSAADADGDSLTFSVSNKPSWASFNTSTGALTGTTTAGVFSNIVISVTDGTNTVSLTAFTITVESVVNNVPKISGTPSTGLYVNQTYDFTPSASDADGDDLSYSISNKPSWAVFNATTGRLSGTATVGTFSNIVISVSDGQTSASLSSFTITVSNRAPVITGTPQTTAGLGSAYSFKPAAYDLDGQTLSFSITNRPGWAAFDEATGELSGTTTAGIYTDIVISVSDGIETVSLPSFSISIASANHAPTITGTPTTSLYVKTAYSFTPTADDDDGDTLTFGVLNKPDWASFSTSTGELSGTPTENDVYHGIVIYVSDGKSTTYLESFDITVNNHAPTISGTMPRYRWNIYLPFTSVFTASDADGDTLTFSLQNQPSGMVINQTTGQLSFFGSTVGTFENIMVTVSDGRTGGVATIGPFTVDVLSWGYTKTGAVSSYIDFDDKYYDQGFEPDFTRDDATDIVTDKLNGVMWQDDASVNVLSLSDASTYCSNLVLGGYDDWYLPDMWTFNSIMDYGRSPAFVSIFQNLDVAATYWTTSQYTFYAILFSGNGRITNVNSFILPAPVNPVKCCRYTQIIYGFPVFKRDHNTKIVDAKGSMLQWDDDTTAATSTAAWSDAVTYCENKTLNGLTDWRLPNIKEMMSILEVSFELSSEFVNVASAPYWTSTTDAGDSSKAWYLNASDGTSATTAKTDNLNIRCVRGGFSE
ncbi:putative Ig domain-containing protein [Seleniivibrio woodruffii]|uniref:putative Ig domain-containing protein n=1 Tax=Seleniivibrio woodruffii TaxID=1078050 RepID=UPI0026EE69D1|nr:putative Ig domain-containing protein [Seleniivibrio woodruffii]